MKRILARSLFIMAAAAIFSLVAADDKKSQTIIAAATPDALKSSSLYAETPDAKVTTPFPASISKVVFDWMLAPVAASEPIEIRWIAADTGGAAPRDTVISTSKSEKGRTSGSFDLTRPTAGFPAGSYRVEISQSGKLIHQEPFAVQPPGNSRPHAPGSPSPGGRSSGPTGAPGPDDDRRGVPGAYVGWWKGISGKGEAKVTEKTGTATVTKDFGHEIKKCEFQVDRNGKITGSGQAIYWFNVTCDADLVVLKRKFEAHLEGGNPTVDFLIEGQMSPEGRVKLSSSPRTMPTLINAGKRSPFDVWNVFGPNEHEVKKEGDAFHIDAVDTFPQINMKIAMKSEKDDCLTLKKRIQYLQDFYLPFKKCILAAHEKFRDSSEWDLNKLPRMGNWDQDFDSLADQVLAEVQKDFPEARVGATTEVGPAGATTTETIIEGEGDEEVARIGSEHEKGHRDSDAKALAGAKERFQKDERKFVEQGSNAFAEYLKWRLGHEIEHYKDQIKKAEDLLEKRKKEYGDKGCIQRHGPLPAANPRRCRNSACVPGSSAYAMQEQ